MRSNLPMYRKDPFVIRKTQPRKGLSRSPPKLFGKDIACELGSRYETIDVHIGNQRMILDLAQGGWIHGNFQSIYYILFLFLLSFQKKQKKQQLTLAIWSYYRRENVNSKKPIVFFVLNWTFYLICLLKLLLKRSFSKYLINKKQTYVFFSFFVIFWIQ